MTDALVARIVPARASHAIPRFRRRAASVWSARKGVPSVAETGTARQVPRQLASRALVCSRGGAAHALRRGAVARPAPAARPPACGDHHTLNRLRRRDDDFTDSRPHLRDRTGHLDAHRRRKQRLADSSGPDPRGLANRRIRALLATTARTATLWDRAPVRGSRTPRAAKAMRIY
jgi:hypothetical protein